MGNLNVCLLSSENHLFSLIRLHYLYSVFENLTMDPQKCKLEFESTIPKLSFESHKGQAGRIGIVGGCKNYTGAPYFAAISALKVGSDLSHVFCTQSASSVIKAYSPELIVHPVLDDPKAADDIPILLSSLHSLVIGPGLGRDENVFQSTRFIIDLAKENNLPLVLDADALFYLNSNLDVISNYKNAILTPNKVEFERLYKAVTKTNLNHDVTVNDVQELSKSLGNVTIVRKGKKDIISDGTCTISCDEVGSPRRCGGQGDLLSGSMGTFNYWTQKYPNTLSCSATVLAAYGACLLTRRCSYLAFKKFKRSTLTSNLIDEIHSAFSSIFKIE